MKQIDRFLNASGLEDLLDCLAQGPSVWRAPVAYHPLNEMRGRKRLLDLVEQPDAVTGYRRPWG